MFAFGGDSGHRRNCELGNRPSGSGAKERLGLRSAMSSLSKRPTLIAGGGPVGVITALALARQGLPVHVFEC
jgi:NADPH-dependent 2,4-dienoyl-CoA reductase/sulfur reductase-like enzyme